MNERFPVQRMFDVHEGSLSRPQLVRGKKDMENWTSFKWWSTFSVNKIG